MSGFADRRIVVFESHGAPEAGRLAKRRAVPKMTPGSAALVGLMDRYLGGLLDPFVTLLEVHKLMYFMKVSGDPALKRLRVVKGLYGPYAENLTHSLREIEGYFISGYRDAGDEPSKELELVPGAVTDAGRFLEDHPDTHARFDRVADLVIGFESSFGLELLSTVHWVVTRESPEGHDDVVAGVYDWNNRKKQFSIRQINLTVDVLVAKGWTEAGTLRAES